MQKLRSRERDVAAKEAASTQQDKQLAEKQADLERRERQLKQSSSQSPAGGMGQLKAENAHIKQQLQNMQTQLAQLGQSFASAEDADQLKAEIARLKELVAQQAMDMYQAQKARQQPARPATGADAKVNGSPSQPSPKQTTAPNASKPSFAKPTQQLPGSGAARAPVESSNKLSGSTSHPKSNAVATGPPPGVATGPANGSGPSKGAAKTKPSADKSSNEIEQLKRQMEEAMQKLQALSSAKGGSSKGTNASHRVPQPVKSKLERETDDLVVYECGHVMHAPPRKIDRRVVGIVYD